MAFVDQSSAHYVDRRSSATAAPSARVRPARPAASAPVTVATAEAVAPAIHESAAATTRRETMSVYLIADEDDDRERLIQGLALDGFRVSAFADAASFYRAFIA